MKQEIEIKIYPIDLLKLKDLLSLADAKLVQEDTLMKRAIFDHRKNPGINCTYARVRDEGRKVTMSLKVSSENGGTILDQKELQITVSSFEDARDLLKGLGLIETNYQENRRETWSILDCELVIDTWPGLETYIEIEGPTEESIKLIVDKLGLDWDKRIFVSTDELYAQKFGLSKEKALELMSNLTFNNIPAEFFG